MITINSNNQEWVFVPVPDAIGYWGEDGKLKWEIPHLVWSGNPPEPSHDEWEYGELQLPEGEYEYVNATDTIIEEQIMEIVDPYKGDRFTYYENGAKLDGYYCETAFYSFRSLLLAHNITTRHAILKKIK